MSCVGFKIGALCDICINCGSYLLFDSRGLRVHLLVDLR